MARAFGVLGSLEHASGIGLCNGQLRHVCQGLHHQRFALVKRMASRTGDGGWESNCELCSSAALLCSPDQQLPAQSRGLTFVRGAKSNQPTPTMRCAIASIRVRAAMGIMGCEVPCRESLVVDGTNVAHPAFPNGAASF